jgi:hypothetical protein
MLPRHGGRVNGLATERKRDCETHPTLRDAAASSPRRLIAAAATATASTSATDAATSASPSPAAPNRT